MGCSYANDKHREDGGFLVQKKNISVSGKNYGLATKTLYQELYQCVKLRQELYQCVKLCQELHGCLAQTLIQQLGKMVAESEGPSRECCRASGNAGAHAGS